MKTVLTLTICAFLLTPLTAEFKSEPRAGTNDYLRSIGYTDEQLSSGTKTEEREPFASAQGAVALQDPVGDVLNRYGASADILVPWADLVGVALKKNESQEQWVVTFTLAEDLQDRPSGKANVLFYVDGDENSTNNAPDGIRAETDREFSIEYTPELSWYTDYRWYNAPEDFWAMNVETAMAFTMSGRDITFLIPFAELPGNLNPTWRAAVAASDGTYTQVDVAPGVGFPPPIGETYPTAAPATGFDWVQFFGFFLILMAIPLGRWLKKRSERASK